MASPGPPQSFVTQLRFSTTVETRGFGGGGRWVGSAWGQGHKMGQANDPPAPEQSKHTLLRRGSEAAPDFRRPVKGLMKVRDCPLGAGASPDLRPDDAPGNRQQLNGGTSAPRPG